MRYDADERRLPDGLYMTNQPRVASQHRAHRAEKVIGGNGPTADTYPIRWTYCWRAAASPRRVNVAENEAEMRGRGRPRRTAVSTTSECIGFCKYVYAKYLVQRNNRQTVVRENGELGYFYYFYYYLLLLLRCVGPTCHGSGVYIDSAAVRP